MELLSPDIVMNLLLSYRDVQVCGVQGGEQVVDILLSGKPKLLSVSVVALSKLSHFSEPQFSDS